MTALKPLENRRVRAVASERYPLNKVCSHPECNEPVADPHHAFPRSAIGGDSWFVEILMGIETAHPGVPDVTVVIPHVTGLCRAHHDDVEEHRAWIKLEDGVWNWYDYSDDVRNWVLIGPLNPQPGSRDGKTKRKKFKGEARRKRATISIKVPKDEREDGAGILADLVETIETMISGEGKHRPVYYTLVDALNYTLTNADETDFKESE